MLTDAAKQLNKRDENNMKYYKVHSTKQYAKEVRFRKQSLFFNSTKYISCPAYIKEKIKKMNRPVFTKAQKEVLKMW